MRSFNLLRYDLKKNERTARIEGLSVLLLSIFYYIFFYMDTLHCFWRTPTIKENMKILAQQNVSMTDSFLYLTGGMLPMQDLSEAADVQYPVKWLVIQLLILFFTAEFAREDISGGGLQILTRVHKQGQWWLSKCIWNLITVCQAYVILFLTWMICSLLTGLGFRGTINDLCFQGVFNTSPAVGEISAGQAVLIFIILPIFTTGAISLVQMTLTLFVRPVMAYLISAIYSILGIFAASPAFLINYAMSTRSRACGLYRFSPGTGLCLCVILMACAFVIGNMRLMTMDIINLPHMEKERSWL